MTAGEVAQILTALAAIGAMLSSWRNAKKIDKQAEKIEVVHKATNSLTDRLVELTAKEAHAAGVKEEFDREKVIRGPPQ